MSEEMQRVGVFDSNIRCILTRHLLQHRLLVRLTNWSEYAKREISDDLVYIRGFADPRSVPYVRYAWTPASLTRKLYRAHFRSLYFMNGLSPRYNYNVTKHMLLRQTERASNNGGIIGVRPLEDPDDIFIYPLYTEEIPAYLLAPIKHIWRYQCGIEDTGVTIPETDVDSSAEIATSVRYLVGLYASWAYIHCFLRSDLQSAVDVYRDASTSLLSGDKLFGFEHFKRMYASYKSQQCKVELTREMQTYHVARVMLLDPITPLARVARMTVRISDSTQMFNCLHEFCNLLVQVFPIGLVKDAHWAVMRVGDAIVLPEGMPLTTEYTKKILCQARLAEQKKKNGVDRQSHVGLRRTTNTRNVRSPRKCCLRTTPLLSCRWTMRRRLRWTMSHWLPDLTELSPSDVYLFH